MAGIENIIFIFLVFFIVALVIFFAKEPGKEAEEKTLKIIKSFIKKKGWTKDDYLLVHNLILQKQKRYWSCEIDILLLTKKWVYVIEVKDWRGKWLSGNINDEYLKYSPGGPKKSKLIS